MDDQSLYLMEEPIVTIFGEVRYLEFHEYIKLSSKLSHMSMTPLHLHYQYRKQLSEVPQENRKEFLEYVNLLKDMRLIELINTDNMMKSYYTSVFETVINFNEGVTVDDILSQEDYLLNMRKLILDMNYVTEEPVSPNPEIQEYYELRRKQKKKESGDVTISDIITSIAVGTPNSFKEIRKMTVIQIYSLYYRIGAFKSFDQSTLIAIASGDGKAITSWTKNIDLFEKQELGTSFNEFNNKYQNIFS